MDKSKRIDYVPVSLNHFYRHTRGMTHEQIGQYILCFIEFIETGGKYSESIANAINSLIKEREIVSDWQIHLNIINKNKTTNSINGKKGAESRWRNHSQNKENSERQEKEWRTDSERQEKDGESMANINININKNIKEDIESAKAEPDDSGKFSLKAPKEKEKKQIRQRSESQQAVDYFCEAYRETYKEDNSIYVPNYARDVKLMKDILDANVSLELIKNKINNFFKMEMTWVNGKRDLGLFKNQFNKIEIIKEKPKPRPLGDD